MDKKAKKILFNTYWSPQGWREEINTSEEDFQYAKSNGLMFDPITITHDDCIKEVLQIKNQISKHDIYKAFLCSLSTRRLDLRSAIASYYIANRFELHKYTPTVSGYFYDNSIISHTSYTCQKCRDEKYGIIGDKEYINADLNVLNFERLKWGGVRHGDILFTYFDLRCFINEDIPEPTKEDCIIFKNILEVISTSKPEDYPGTLEKRLKDIFPSNKNERKTILEILGCIGILEAKSYDRPLKGKDDWIYITHWRGEDAYNSNVVDEYFGSYLNKL